MRRGVRRVRQQRQLTKASDKAKLAAFLLNRYGPAAAGLGAWHLAAAEAVATSADEEVVCEGEKTREERDARSCLARPCRLTSEAVSGSGEVWGN